MKTNVVQRWSKRRGVYLRADTTIATALYDVEPIPDDRTAKAFVLEHHYSASYPSAQRRYGLYCLGDLVGVAVFSVPMQARVLDRCPGDRQSSTELGRLVLRDSVPANGESWFVRRCFELLASEGFTGIVSFADPVPRTTLAGEQLFVGHVGTVYQALNATYAGRSSAATLRLLPDGRVLSARALAKIRARDQGWRYSAAMLELAGADPLDDHEDAAAWVRRWVPAVTRKLRHHGNHVYVWALDKRLRPRLPAPRPYPKLEFVPQTLF